MKRVLILAILLCTSSLCFAQELPVGEVVKYPSWHYVDTAELFPTGIDILDPEILVGNPEDIHVFVRFDNISPTGNITGLFAIDAPLPVKVRLTLPTDEYATVTYGLILIKDETGKTRLYKPGDSWFLRAGTTIEITHLTEQVQHTIFWPAPGS